MADPDYDAISFVIASKYRESVIDALTNPKTPKRIAESTDHQMAHVSRALGELSEQDVVELLVDEDTKKGRLYRLTDKGKEVKDNMEEWE